MLKYWNAAGKLPLHYFEDGPPAGENALHLTNATYRFESTTQAALRYIELYLLLSTCRSIPLGTKKTHVGKTDSHGRWERIYDEFATLCRVFPKSFTEPWYLIAINLMVSLDAEARRKKLEEEMGKKWTRYLFERRSNQAFRDLTISLKEHNMLTPTGGNIQHEEYHDAAA